MEKTFIDPFKIKVDEDRQRKVFDEDALQGLMNSIEKHGQLQPIIVTRDFRVIAGERRLRSCQALKRDVWYVFQDTLTPIQEKEIELEENFRRENLSWQESAEAIYQLHQLRIAQYGRATPKSANTNTWSLEDTANSLDISRQTVGFYCQIAEASKTKPEIYNEKSMAAALQFLRKKKETEIIKAINVSIVEEIKKNEEVSPVVLFSDVAYHGDAVDYLRGVEKESVDIIYCDPMWGEGIDDKMRVDKFTHKSVNDDPEHCWNVIDATIKEASRILKNDRWMVMWIGVTGIDRLKFTCDKYGLSYDDIPCLWIKPNGYASGMLTTFGRAFEVFLLIKKGKPVLTKERTRNYFLHPTLTEKDHQFAKPVSLAEEVLSYLTLPGMRAIDPFMGTGRSLVAMRNLGLSPFGCELDEEFFEKAAFNWQMKGVK